MMSAQIILASASPRRQELLDQINIRHQVLPVDIDETPHENEVAEDYVQRLALQKAQAGFQLSATELPTLGSDTVVVLDQQILGKPQHQQHGIDMLKSLSGREHQVMTAVSVVDGSQTQSALSISKVRFCALTDAQILAYWNTNEAADKAGAYAIQGIAAQFIEHLEGSYSGVMGLPLMETARLLRRFKIYAI